MFEVSSCLGTCNVKGASEKDIAPEFSCVLMVSGKLNEFSGKHQMLTVNSQISLQSSGCGAEKEMTNGSQK